MINQRFSLIPIFEKSVRLTPVSVCAMLRFNCAAYSGLPVRLAPAFAAPNQDIVVTTQANRNYSGLLKELVISKIQTQKTHYANLLIKHLRETKAVSGRIPKFYAKIIEDALKAA